MAYSRRQSRWVDGERVLVLDALDREGAVEVRVSAIDAVLEDADDPTKPCEVLLRSGRWLRIAMPASEVSRLLHAEGG